MQPFRSAGEVRPGSRDGAPLPFPGYYTGTAAGKCFLDMLGVFAEFETNLRRERQLEGIAKAKAAGVYKSRPASIDAARVRELKAQGMSLPPSPRPWALAGRAYTGRCDNVLHHPLTWAVNRARHLRRNSL
jgi:DNA invertase Pin-like site-specific DNA recombinase